MNGKNLHPGWTFGIGIVSFLIATTGGVIGDMFGLLALVCIVLGIVGFVESRVKKQK